MVVLALEPQGIVSGQPALERCVHHSFCRSWCFRLCTPLEGRQEAWYFRSKQAIIMMFQCSALLKLEPVRKGEVRERGQWRYWAVEGVFSISLRRCTCC